MWWCLGLAYAAELPLPAFDEAVATAHWYELNAILDRGCRFEPRVAGVVCAEGVTKAVIAGAKAFRRDVFDDAGIIYLQGLAHRYAGEEAAAMRAWEASVALDPGYHAAWYDLGELHLVGGRTAEAKHAFGKVAELTSATEMPWLGHQRLAEVAAFEHDAEAFERHTKAALERGFSFAQVAEWPNWRGFYADPALRDVMDKLLTVYATPETRRQLIGEPTP